MKALVTGCAGFIGSHVTERLLTDGWEVVGVDSFTPYYDPTIKRKNISNATKSTNFHLLEKDIRALTSKDIPASITHVFHLAGQPGVRSSWGTEFATYIGLNIEATQHLLELCLGKTSLQRFVYSSSSSVYGEQPFYPVSEGALPSPISPYGVSKLAAEQLCLAYRSQFGIPTVALRYFTVYGPRQRPEMAIQILMRAAISGKVFSINGNGNQLRDFTYVQDVVNANLCAAKCIESENFPVYNIGSENPISILELVEMVSDILSKEIHVEFINGPYGDPTRTSSSSKRARATLGWVPTTTIRDGLNAQAQFVISSFGLGQSR